jgi:hypothetical protein
MPPKKDNKNTKVKDYAHTLKIIKELNDMLSESEDDKPLFPGQTGILKPKASNKQSSKPVVKPRVERPRVAKEKAKVAVKPKFKNKKGKDVKPLPTYKTEKLSQGAYFELPDKVRIHEESRFKDKMPNTTHQTDLMFFSKDQTVNRPKLKGKQAVVVSDVKTKKTDVRLIDGKNASDVVAKTKDIYENGDYLDPPKFRIMSDSGKEFKNQQYNDYVKELGVKQVFKPGKRHTLGKVDHKIGLLKDNLFKKYDKAVDKEEPIVVKDMIENVVQEYNAKVQKKGMNSYNDEFKEEPENLRVSAKVEGKRGLPKKEQEIHQVGDIVKLKEYKNKFKKGEQRWSSEDYVITNVLINPDSPPRYILDKYNVDKKEAYGQPDNSNPVHYKHIRSFDSFRKKK